METYGEDGQGCLWPSACRKREGKEEAADDLAGCTRTAKNPGSGEKKSGSGSGSERPGLTTLLQKGGSRKGQLLEATASLRMLVASPAL